MRIDVCHHVALSFNVFLAFIISETWSYSSRYKAHRIRLKDLRDQMHFNWNQESSEIKINNSYWHNFAAPDMDHFLWLFSPLGFNYFEKKYTKEIMCWYIQQMLIPVGEVERWAFSLKYLHSYLIKVKYKENTKILPNMRAKKNVPINLLIDNPYSVLPGVYWNRI